MDLDNLPDQKTRLLEQDLAFNRNGGSNGPTVLYRAESENNPSSPNGTGGPGKSQVDSAAEGDFMRGEAPHSRFIGPREGGRISPPLPAPPMSMESKTDEEKLQENMTPMDSRFALNSDYTLQNRMIVPKLNVIFLA